MKENRCRFLFPAACACLLALPGCGLREVQFTVSRPSPVEAWGVKRLAVFEFTGPAGQSENGKQFSRSLARLLQPAGASPAYTVMDPETCQPMLLASGFSPSVFQESAAVSEMGRRLGVDALLFGDLEEASVSSEEQTETVNSKVGERREEFRDVGPDGKERTVTKDVPVMQDIQVKTIQRTARIRAAARMVRCRDNSILWQDEVQMDRTAKSQISEEGDKTGDWSTDDVLLGKALEQAGKSLLKRILPASFSRIRNLAETSTDDSYGQLVKQGNAAALSGHWGEATDHWKKARDESPDRPEAVANLGVVKERNRDFEGALKDYTFAAQSLGSPWSGYCEDVKPLPEDLVKH